MYIFWNRAFWKHACEPRRARHMRGNFTRTCVTSWVHPCGLILTRACGMPRITQTFCFLFLKNLKLKDLKSFLFEKSARFADTFSSRAVRFARNLSAPRTRDSIVALRAPKYLDFTFGLNIWSNLIRTG